MTILLDWIDNHETLLWWLGAGSVLTFVGSLVLIPVLIVRIPADYFTREERHPGRWDESHPALRLLMMFLKNTLGGVFILAGAAMLLGPGQGVLTILIGITLIDFPGKFTLERWIISHKPVNRAANWVRAKAHHKPLELPDDEA